MTKSTTGGRTIAVLSLAIVGVLGGGVAAAATHTDGSSHSSAAPTRKPADNTRPMDDPITRSDGTVVVSEPTADPNANQYVNAAGYSLLAQVDMPFVAMYQEQLEVYKAIHQCDSATDPRACFIVNNERLARSYDTAHAALLTLKLPATVSKWTTQTLTDLQDNATSWHTFLDRIAGSTKAQAEKEAKVLGDKADKLEDDVFELDYAVGSLVPNARVGKDAPTSLETVLKQMVQDAEAQGSEVTGQA